MITFEELELKIYSRARREGTFGPYHMFRQNFEDGEYTSVPQFKEKVKKYIEVYGIELSTLENKPCELSGFELEWVKNCKNFLATFYSLWEECLK